MDITSSNGKQTFSYLSKTSTVEILFQDLNYVVQTGRNEKKCLLKKINGEFKSGQLTAILGASGAGKTTLLNTLAGYKCEGNVSGSILVNGRQRDNKEFGKISRYIMQRDLIQPKLTVEEAMMMAADLKLNKNVAETDKIEAINEVLDLLKLTGTKNTMTDMISGGERRRLSIALELLNNPPVLFLDEPTTGLDDFSCSQCVSLLKMIALQGRTVICSIHTPSAKLFNIFDRVYLMSLGQCIYQGYGPDCISFLSNVGLDCPKHYNPADFIIEVSCGEYGNFQNNLVLQIENGNKIFNSLDDDKYIETVRDNYCMLSLLDVKDFDNVTWLTQFWIILRGMWLQMYRDKSSLLLHMVLYLSQALLIGFSYYGIGHNAARIVINSRFLFVIMVFFLYIPLMPVLVRFPSKIQILKKEHFNKWYKLSAYFCALSFSTMPLLFIFGMIFILIVYTATDQPLEMSRFVMFSAMCIMTGMTAESFGQLVSARLSLVNGMFVAPVLMAPLLLLAVHGMGTGYEMIPLPLKILIKFSFLRYSLEGIVYSIFDHRGKFNCPETEQLCYYRDADYFLKEMGFNDGNFVWNFLALVVIMFIFRGGSFYLLKQRLNPDRTFVPVPSVFRFISYYLISIKK